MKINKTQLIDKIANEVIKKIDTHGSKFLKSWVALGLPKNIRGSNYTGFNVISLWVAKEENKFKSNVWATFNQIKNKGGQVLKGSTASDVMYMQPALYRKAKENEEVSKNGSVKVQYNLMRLYKVFNLDQTTLKDSDVIEADGSNTLPNIETYLKNTGAIIKYGVKENLMYSDMCYYVPSHDYIGMVDKTSFKTINGATATQNFYSVVLHELTHWTGHETRCNRKAKYEGKFFNDFNSADKYAFEELVAEIGASIQCCMLGLTNEPAKHSLQYLSGWKAKLKAKPETILKASAMAQAGVRFIDNLQKKHPA